MTTGTDDWRLRRDDVGSFRLKFKKRRFQMIDDSHIAASTKGAKQHAKEPH
jgi:hypothetical protein